MAKKLKFLCSLSIIPVILSLFAFSSPAAKASESSVTISGYFYDVDTKEILPVEAPILIKEASAESVGGDNMVIRQMATETGKYKLEIKNPDGYYYWEQKQSGWIDAGDRKCYITWACEEDEFDLEKRNMKVDVPIGETPYSVASGLTEDDNHVESTRCEHLTNMYQYRLIPESPNLMYFNIPLKCEEKVKYQVIINGDKEKVEVGDTLNIDVAINNITNQPIQRDAAKKVNLLCSVEEYLNFEDASVQPTSISSENSLRGKDLYWEGLTFDENKINLKINTSIDESLDDHSYFNEAISCYLTGEFSNEHVNNGYYSIDAKGRFDIEEFLPFLPFILFALFFLYMMFSVRKVYSQIQGKGSLNNIENIKSLKDSYSSDGNKENYSSNIQQPQFKKYSGKNIIKNILIFLGICLWIGMLVFYLRNK